MFIHVTDMEELIAFIAEYGIIHEDPPEVQGEKDELNVIG